jgi:hypothetical protein
MEDRLMQCPLHFAALGRYDGCLALLAANGGDVGAMDVQVRGFFSCDFSFSPRFA